MTGNATERAQLALDAYRAALKPAVDNGNVYEFSLTPIDRLGLPLWTVALIPQDGALCDGFGYGPSLTAAQTSAWGETIEWYFAREALKHMPRRVASYHELVTDGNDAVDPISLCLSAGSDYTHHQPLTWVAGRRHPSGDQVLVPIEAVAPRYADIGAHVDPRQFLLTPITNGLGAGPSFEHALAHGILELMQRDGNSVNYRALDRGIAVALDDVRDEETRLLLSSLAAQGVDVIVKLATTDFGMANLYVVGVDRDITLAPQPISLSSCGEAVHPDRERALAKAVREFVSARARKAFNHGPLAPVRKIAAPGYLGSFRPASLRSEDDRALTAMREWLALDHQQFFTMLRDPVLSVREHVHFSQLPTVEPSSVEDPRALLELLTERVAAAGLEIMYVEFAHPTTGVSVLKAIVPGLEVETMTYQRIGRRNLERLLKRNSPIVGIGTPQPGARQIVLRDVDEQQLGGRAWLDPAALDHTVGRLYALYREPGRHVIGFLAEREAGSTH